MKIILHCISIKNIEFYIEIDYFIFYISFHLHQTHIKLIIVDLKFILHSFISLLFHLLHFSYLGDLKPLFYVYYIKKSNFNFKN